MKKVPCLLIVTMILFGMLPGGISCTAYAADASSDITSKMIASGSASYNASDNSILLCPAETWSSGNAKYPDKIEGDFSVSFEYKIGGGTGADGIVFSFFSKEEVPDGNGEYLNFDGNEGYGVEFDTYQNTNDSPNPHIAVIHDRVSNHLISVDDERVNDGKWHLANISVQGNGIVIKIDGETIIDEDIIFNIKHGYMYFAASTGTYTDNHYIRNITLSFGGKISAEAIQTGLKIKLPALTTGIGFRIYRSEAPGTEGDVIANLVSGASFIDVNVEAGKTYYYTVREVFADGGLSETSDTIAVSAPEELLGDEIAGEKSFILMRIGEPMMSVNGAVHEIDPGRGTVPVIQNGRTLVPIRAIIEAMNGSVGWNEATKQITLDTTEHHIEMWLAQKGIVADGDHKEMDIAPTTINARTMLPIRFVAENAGCAIEWIGSTQEVVIVFPIS